MLNEFSGKAMQRARYEEKAGRWYGQIPDFPGVLAGSGFKTGVRGPSPGSSGGVALAKD